MDGRMISYCSNCNGMWLSSEEADDDHLTDRDHEAMRCSPDTIGRCVEGSLIDVWFTVFDHTQQVYGGPEEGGWMKTVFSPVASLMMRGRIVEECEDVGSVESGPRLRTWMKLEVVKEDKKLMAEIEEVYKERLKYTRHGHTYYGHDTSVTFLPAQGGEFPPYYS